MKPPETGNSADSREHWFIEEQRELAQEALLKGEGRLQALLDDCMAAVYLKDLEGRYLMVNRLAEIMFHAATEEVVGKTDHELFPKEVADVLRANDLEALEAEVPVRFVHEDGEHTYEVSEFLLYDSAGDLYAACGIAIDIVEYDRAEKNLRESEERFRGLVEQASDAFFIHNAEGRILDVNQQACESLGYAREELLALPIEDVEKSISPEALAELWESVAPGEPVTVDGVHQRKDGTSFPVEVRVGLFEAGGGRLMLALARDVTERKEAEEKLREAKEKYRGIFENAVEGIFQTARDGSFISVNPALARILGYASPEEITSRLTDVQEVYVDPSRRGEFVELMRENDRVTEFESRICREDGSIAWISESARAVRDSDGALLYFEGFVVDITGRKEAEEALKESEERFRSLVHNASDLITILDVEGTIRYESPSVEPILGRYPGELVGEKAWDYVHPDDLEPVLQAFSRTVENPGEMLDAVEFRFRHKDGSWRYLEAVGNNLMDLPSVGGIVANSRDVTERKQAEEALRESETRYRTVVGAAFDAIVTMAADGVIRSFNQAAGQVFGYKAEEVVGQRLELLMPERFRSRHRAGLRRYLDTGRSNVVGQRRLELVGRRKDGGEFPLELSISEMREGEDVLFVGSIRDITERREAEKALKESEERYRAVMEESADGIWLFDPETQRLLEFNETFRELLGYTAEELEEMTIYDFVAHDPEEIDAVTERNLQEGRHFIGERKYRRKDGSLLDVEVSASVIPYQGKEVICRVARDITERKVLEEQLTHQAFYDPLTELPNRALFLDRLKHALAQTDRNKEPVAVLFVDLDDFKVVNDSLGHDAGNDLLVGVAERLRGAIRPGDTVARLFGDEFAVLLEAPAELDHARRVTERIGDRLTGPFVVEGQEAFVSASIGIALSDSAEDQPGDVLRRADLAMYTAKRKRKARYEVYQPSMDTYATERLDLENQLRRAIEREEFEVYYQPVIDIASGEVNGLEALARWHHPERGLVSPGEFIVLAEETGLIRPIGRWVLQEACRQAMQWREHYPALLMSVNLSTSQFSHQPDLISEVLEETGMDPRGLQLEITERVVMDDAEFSLGKLQQLKGLGVRFAIDDYGTGYSCLYYLKRMPVSLLKIDRTFIAGLGSDQGDEAIVAGTVSLAHALGLEVVAEGVETADQLAKLEELKCDMVQGFYFAKPLPGEEIPLMLPDS